jgi:DNA polymerase IV
VPDRRLIAHLDMDAFYVAVELLRHPELRGKPVMIAGRGPRAVVTTASYEARRFGVGSAIPAAQARRLCPEILHLPVDMAHYRRKSTEVMALVDALEAPREAVSLDEVYLDLTKLLHPIERMSALVRRIRDELHLDASVGMGPNKLVAKVASDAEKPRGFVLLTREQAARRFAEEPTTLIPGIGPKTGERLRRLGIETIAALQTHPTDRLVSAFGERHGRYLHDRAHFHDDSPVAERTAKSRSVETTFDRDVSDPAELEAVLRRQSHDLAGTLQRRGWSGRTIAIKVRLDDFTTLTRAHTLPDPTSDPETISEVSAGLLRANPPARPVRLLGVRVGGFDAARAQLSLVA